MTWLAVVAGTLVAAFTVWGWRRTESAAAYFAASRRAGAVVAGLGGTAAGLSAFVFLGGPGLFASIGVASLWIVLSAPFTSALQCLAVGGPVVRLAHRHGCLTVPELLEARYGGRWPQGLAALAVIVGGIATLAVQAKGIAVFGEILFDVPGAGVAAIAVLATVAYTTAGGMRAGIIAEALQGAIMATTALAISWIAVARAGGPSSALEMIQRLRPELLEPFNDPENPVIDWTNNIGLRLASFVSINYIVTMKYDINIQEEGAQWEHRVILRFSYTLF